MDIATMPRGGPDASWLDRQLETDCQEYLDRDDIDDAVKQKVVRGLDQMGRMFKDHQRHAQLALDEVADVADPKILELGAGHGALSRLILDMHPTAEVTITDIDPTSVHNIAAGDLGKHPRATVRVMDATAIDASDRSFDLAVFALSFHHLPPELAAQAIAEGTRVADKLLIIDLPRLPSLLHLVKLATFAPFAPVFPLAHDGFISSLRAYSRSAFQALADHAGAGIGVQSIGSSMMSRAVVFSRAS